MDNSKIQEVIDKFVATDMYIVVKDGKITCDTETGVKLFGKMDNNTNDQRIIALKKEIIEKKKSIGKPKVFIPITNCSLELDGTRHNIHVLTKENLLQIAVKLNSYKISAKDLGLTDEYTISGFPVEDWIKDIKSRLEIIKTKEEELKLKVLEDKLTKLLSEGKKVELELDEIENDLKGEI